MKKVAFLLTLFFCTFFSNVYSWNVNSSLYVFSFQTKEISFVEDGIRFHVYLNGDFSIDEQRVGNNFDNRNLKIERDAFNHIKKVGNIRIKYNSYGKVEQIGSILLKYDGGKLVRIGNLKIVYDRRGNYTFYGRVRYNDSHYDNYINGSTTVFDFHHPFFGRSNFKKSYIKVNEDKNYIYYQAVKNDGEIKRGTMVKREKDRQRNSKRKKEK